MASQFEELRLQLAQSLEQTRALSLEVTEVNRKLAYLDNGRNDQERLIRELQQANARLAETLAAGQGDREERGHSSIKLIDMKTMAPKTYAGKPEEPFRAWAKKVRSFCNASRPGFRKFLRWVETQTTVVDEGLLTRNCDWKYKAAASEVMYDLLTLHTTDDALILVELQVEENGLEAWRQLCARFDPIGEGYVLDAMTGLLDVPRCTKLVELPSAIARWQRSLSTYTQKTGGSTIPADWKLPVLFKMVPLNQLDDIRMRHKYAVGEEKLYDGFSRMLIALAGEKSYDLKHAKNPNDMEVDSLAAAAAAAAASAAEEARERERVQVRTQPPAGGPRATTKTGCNKS